MEVVIKATIQDTEIIIPKKIIKKMGPKLKSIYLNNFVLLIASECDNRFQGEPLLSEGTSYFLPENHLSALNIKPGDRIKLVFSVELGFIILKKYKNMGVNND